MVRSFEGTHVAITGGGSGIGLELAREFVRHEAAAVSLLDISDCAGAVADLLAEAAGSCSILCCCVDVTQYQQACPQNDRRRVIIFLCSRGKVHCTSR